MQSQTNQQNIITLSDLYDETAEDAVLAILVHDPLLTTRSGLLPTYFSSWKRRDLFLACLNHDGESMFPPADLDFEVLDLYLDYLQEWREASLDALRPFAERVKAAGELRRSGVGPDQFSEEPEDFLPAWAKREAPKVITSTADILDHALMMRYADKDLSGGDLAGELWEEPIMVAPARSHFDMEYPEEPTKQTCVTNWVVDIHADKIKARGVRFPIRQRFITKGGKVIGACPHCLHERTVQLCRQIEKASEQYAGDLLMRWTAVSAEEAGKIGERIKKRNQRNKEGIFLSVVKVPMVDGRVWLLHDAPDLAGEELPNDRADLYSMVYELVANMPKGSRGWRGLASWGFGQTVKIKLEKESQGEKKKGGKEEKPIARLIGQNFGKFATLLRGYLDTEESITKRDGIEFKGDPADFLRFLDSAGLDYAVIDGDLSRLVDIPNSTSLKRDKLPAKSAQRGLWEPPEQIIEDIPGF